MESVGQLGAHCRMMLCNETPVLELSPDRTASLPGGALATQIRGAEPRSDRFGFHSYVLFSNRRDKMSHSEWLTAFAKFGSGGDTASLLPGC